MSIENRMPEAPASPRIAPKARKSLVAAAAMGLLLGASACATMDPAAETMTSRCLDMSKIDKQEAFAMLSGEDGPVRFSKVTSRVYRGGQPNDMQIELLHRLGVRTIVNLRRENDEARLAEQRKAESLGIKFLHYPFYGVFGAEQAWLEGIVSQVADENNGAVYVHCKHGRDRTSLIVALFRVIEQRWEPDTAWKKEALAFDHDPTFWYAAISSTFRDVTSSYQRASTAGEAATSVGGY